MAPPGVVVVLQLEDTPHKAPPSQEVPFPPVVVVVRHLERRPP